MTAYYCVVRYVPDPVLDERINIGVVVFGDGQVRSEFLKHRQRVRHFRNGDISFLDHVIEDINGMSEEKVKEVADRWMNSIQFSKPAASILNPDQLLKDVTSRFLLDYPEAARAYRNRRDAIRMTVKKLRTALVQQAGLEAGQLVRTQYPIDGKFDRHEFDIAAENGELMLLAQTISFEGPVSKRFTKELHATAWSIEDVKRENPELPLSVVTLAPKVTSKTYERAVHTFKEVGAEIVPETELDEWASQMANAVAKQAHFIDQT